MTCPRCQTANPPGATACTSCGFVLGRGGSAAGAGQRKGLAIASLVLGILSLPTAGGLLIGAILAIALGVTAVVKASKSPAEYGGKGLAIVGIVTGALSFIMIPFIGIIAAIAIPSLLRARVSANESAAIGDIRTVIVAEAAYRSANSGYYDTLECLNAPTRCIPNYLPGAPTFIDATLLRTTKGGYRRAFHAGSRADASSAPISPSSMKSFAYVVVPVAWGQTGFRAFCGDDSGVIRQSRYGRAPEVSNGACAPSDEPLQ